MTTFVLGTLASALPMRARLTDIAAGRSDKLTVLECAPSHAATPPRHQTQALLERAAGALHAGRGVSELEWLDQCTRGSVDAGVPVQPASTRLFHMDRYRFASRYVAGKSLLDCASGSGCGAFWLAANALASSVVGLDPDERAVCYARRHYARENVTFNHCDDVGPRLFAVESFDVVTSFDTIDHVPDDRARVEQFWRVLRRDGLLIVSTPNGRAVDADCPTGGAYDVSTFRALLAERFEVLEVLGHWLAGGGLPGRIGPMTAPQQPASLVAVCRRTAR